MTDLIGTVRREEHEPDGTGFSIWVCIGQQEWSPPDKAYVLASRWECAYSTSHGNCGETLPRGVVEGENFPVVGAIPGTPAAEQAATP